MSKSCIYQMNAVEGCKHYVLFGVAVGPVGSETKQENVTVYQRSQHMQSQLKGMVKC